MNTPETTARASEHSDAAPHLQFSSSRTVKEWIVAFSMANWMFVRAWANLLSGTPLFFNKLPVVRAELLALMVCVTGAASVIWLGIALWRRISGTVPRVVLELAFVALLILPIDYFRTQYGWTGREVVIFVKHPAGLLSLLVVAGLIVCKHTQMVRGLAVIVGITFPLALLNMAKIVLFSLNAIHPSNCERSPATPPLLPLRQAQARVVWTIFDEMDYRLAFEQRLPKAKLPEFDRLQKESLSSEHAYPPAGETSVSMPALISGRRLLSTRPIGCELRLTLADTGGFMDWSAAPSVFSRARGMGFNTGLVGWHLPYDRMLGGSLDYCSWYSNPLYEPASATNFFGSIQQQLESLGGIFHVRQLFIEACKAGLKDSLSVVADTNLSLLLLHLPPPHDPCVFIPEKNEFSLTVPPTAASYFNNLALADRELGELRRAIETSKDRDNTWLIVSADHSWRRSKQYDGRRDRRVPFLVKGPGNEAPGTYSRQFNTLVTGDLILAILRGEIRNQADVAAWLDVHGKADLPVTSKGEAVE